MRVSLDVETGHRFNQLCNLEMKISKTGVGHYFSAEIIDIEIDTEQYIIQLIFSS